MDIIQELEKVRATLTGTVVTAFDRIIEGLENPNSETEATAYEMILPLSADPYIFIGKKPTAVLFGEERVEVKTWRQVYDVILKRCIENPQHYETLMDLRDRIAGRDRVLVSANPDGMRNPTKIAEGLYGETHYGSQTLMYILVERILAPVGFDCSNISIAINGSRI